MILSRTFNALKMKLLGSTKSKIIKDENGENVSHLEITEVVLIHCNIVNKGSSARFKSLDFPILKYGLLIKILNHLR